MYNNCKLEIRERIAQFINRCRVCADILGYGDDMLYDKLWNSISDNGREAMLMQGNGTLSKAISLEQSWAVC